MTAKVHQLKKGHANCYILNEEGLVMVDTGMGWKKELLWKEFQSRNLNPRDVRLIIITHEHIDHFGGLQTCLDLCGNPPVLCHIKAASALETGKSVAVKPRNTIGRIVMNLTKFTSKSSVRVKPAVLIDQETDLSGYGISARVIPTPGHSLCSLSVLMENGSALLGDTVMPGFGGNAGLPFFAEDMKLLRGSYEILEHQITGTCYTGHGGPFKADEVIAMMHHHIHLKGLHP
jgi:glyoxylase-like metal-dependent hydrolase (beta-lactamase superfamily II)